MKFSNFTAESWEANAQYYDTCLLPYAGLQGGENPHEAAAALERLRDLLEMIERPFQGRVITYPAVQYAAGDSIAYLNEVCRKVKSNMFQFVIIASLPELTPGDIYESDLILSVKGFDTLELGQATVEIGAKIQAIWQEKKN